MSLGYELGVIRQLYSVSKDRLGMQLRPANSARPGFFSRTSDVRITIKVWQEPLVSHGRFFAQAGGGFLRRAARHMMHEPIAIFVFLPPPPFKQPMHVVAFLRAQLVPDSPQFFDVVLVFHITGSFYH